MTGDRKKRAIINYSPAAATPKSVTEAIAPANSMGSSVIVGAPAAPASVTKTVAMPVAPPVVVASESAFWRLW